jgi:2-keto-3-deoxy-L-rhamnonate aldolase RhmA
MKVVGIGKEKGRCYEYLPFMTTNVKEADEIMNDQAFDFLQLDEQYALNELATLKIRVAEGFTAETTKYQFNLPAISTMEINSIIDSLDAMKNEISNRISILD